MTESASSEPPRYDPDLIALVFLLSRIGRLNEQLLTIVQAELVKSAKKPRTETECFVLISLLLQGEPYSLSPTTLCAFSMQTPGGMTKTLNRLEADALIRRRMDRSDRRALLVELTAKGQRTTRTLLDHTLGGYAKAFQGIAAPDRQQLVKVLRTALTALENATGTEPTEAWVDADHAGQIRSGP